MHVLNDKLLKKILGDPRYGGTRHAYPKGSVLFTEGEHASDLFIHLTGVNAVFKGGSPIAALREPGRIFGETALTPNSRRTATVQAAEDVSVLRIPRDMINGFLHAFPQVSEPLSFLLAERLEESEAGVFSLMDPDTSSDEAILFTDEQGRLLSLNRGAELLLGITREHGIGRPLQDFFVDPAPVRQGLSSCSSEGAAGATAFRSGPQPGTIHLRFSAQHQGPGAPVGCLVVASAPTAGDAPPRGRTGKRVLLSLAMLLLLALPLLLWSLLRENDPNDPLLLFEGRLEADHKVFIASISPLLAASDIDSIAEWFESYARAEGQPLLYSRAVLIGPTRIARMACGLDPFSRLTGLEGSSYTDLKLLPPDKNPIQILTLYRVDEGNPMGRRESEAVFVLSGGIGTSSMLAMQLNMERLRSEYGLDEDDLRSLAPGRN